jgi:hypothetical protein
MPTKTPDCYGVKQRILFLEQAKQEREKVTALLEAEKYEFLSRHPSLPGDFSGDFFAVLLRCVTQLFTKYQA